MAKIYIAYDGRALTNPDEAVVLEVLGKFTAAAWISWQHHDAVLVEYEQDGNQNLINERIVGEWDLGYLELKSRCAE